MFSFENDRVRFCSQCNLNVYNLSGMRREEAEALVAKTEGRLCVRFYRKADGSILTQNCPVGLKAIKRRVAWVAQVALGMALSFVSGLGLYIYHLGRQPFPRSLFELRHAEMGAIPYSPSHAAEAGAFEVSLPNAEEPQIGAVLIEPRRRTQISQGKTRSTQTRSKQQN
jgi:hypothetical protein